MKQKPPFVDPIYISSQLTCSLNLHIVTRVPRSTKKMHLRSSCRWLWQWLLLQLPLFHNAQIHSLTERVTDVQLDATGSWWIITCQGKLKKDAELFFGSNHENLGEFTNTIYKLQICISKKPGAAQILPKKYPRLYILMTDRTCCFDTEGSSNSRQYPKILMEIGSDSWTRWWINLCMVMVEKINKNHLEQRNPTL